AGQAGDRVTLLAHEIVPVRTDTLVASGAVAEVDVAHEPKALEGLQVAIDRSEIRAGQPAVEPARDLLRLDWALGGVDRLEHEAAGRRESQAVSADRGPGGVGAGGEAG